MSTIDTGLIQGPAQLFVRTAGETLPLAADVPALKAGTFTGWEGVGRTTAAVTLKDTPSLVEAKSQQSSRVEAVGVSSWDTTVESTLRQVTLDRLALAIHGLADAETVSPNASGVAAVSAFAFVGPWGTESVLVVVERGTVASGLTVAFDRENFSEIPLTIQVLEGDTLPAGYKIYVTVPAI